MAAMACASSPISRSMPWISAPSAPAIGRMSSVMSDDAASMRREVRLLPRMRVGEGGDAHAGFVDTHGQRIGIEGAFEDLRRRDLRHQADVGDRRAVAVAEAGGGFLLDEQP